MDIRITIEEFDKDGVVTRCMVDRVSSIEIQKAKFDIVPLRAKALAHKFME